MSSDDEDAGRRPPEDPNASLPALFWDAMPENPEQHPDWLAMQALAEECPPEERAENFKVQGNRKLKAGLEAKSRALLREAAAFYAQGLSLQCGDSAVNAALHNNSAHVHLLLGNWRKALQHAQAVLALQPDSIKACFRGAKAALQVGDHAAASALVERGLALEPGAKEMLHLQQESVRAAQRALQQAQRDAQQRADARRPAEELAAAICGRGVHMTQPQVAAVGTRRPHLDAGGTLHWPVFFVYPETMQQDVVEDVEEGHALADHLDVMFAEGAPPLEWDDQHEYTRGAVELYYLANAGPPLSQEELAAFLHGGWPEGFDGAEPTRYGCNAAAWRRVDERRALSDVLQEPDHMVPGVPLFWVVARGSSYRDRFLAQELRR